MCIRDRLYIDYSAKIYGIYLRYVSKEDIHVYSVDECLDVYKRQRYIRLTELIPELLDLVDNKKLQFTVAVDISYIDKEVQEWIYEYISDTGFKMCIRDRHRGDEEWQ